MGKRALMFEKKSDEVELNMSPLIDMIFILLIFFLVTTTFVKESGVDINRPISAPPKNAQKEEANIQINVTRDGMVYIDGQAIDIRSVQSRMERFKYENPDGNVIITADNKSKFGMAIEVLDQVRLANIKNVVVTPAAESITE